MNASDGDLVRAFRDGNDLAFVNLYNRFKHSIYVFCLKMICDEDATKDIVQNVFLKIFERKHQLADAGKFTSWLFTIARNDCLTYLRRAGFASELPDNIEDTTLPLHYDRIDRDEEVILVNKAIARLKPDLREVIILREYENLSYKQIADIIKVNESVVKSRLFTARQKLYEILKPMYAERK